MNALIEHIAACGTCDVDVATMTGAPCPDAAELAEIAGVDIPPEHECVINSADPCDNCRALEKAARGGRKPPGSKPKPREMSRFRRACRDLAQLVDHGWCLEVDGNGNMHMMTARPADGGDRIVATEPCGASGDG